MDDLKAEGKRYRDFYNFSWSVPEVGFRFQTHKEHSGKEKVRCLVLAADGSRTRPQHPLKDHTGLFQQFSELSLDEGSMLKFANQFGRLGGEVSRGVIDDRQYLIDAEPFSSWKTEITDMRRLLHFWERLREGDAAYLKKLITFTPEAIHIRFHDGLEAVVAFRGDARFGELQGDLQTGWSYLGREINIKLARYPVNTRLMQDRRDALELTMVINPSSLISALWFQFARAIEGNREYRRCEFCKVPFEVGMPGTKRSDARFCTDSHRAAFNAPPKPKSKRRRRKHA